MILYTTMICLIFSSKDTWISSHNPKWMYINMLITIGFLGLKMLYKKSINRQQLIIISVLFVLIYGSMIANFDIAGFSMFIILLIALFIEETFEFNEFYKKLENIIFIFTLVSLVGTALWIGGLNESIVLLKLVYIVGNDAVPWGFRLYGIFREPAMYCIYLGLALARCLIISENTNYFKVLIYLTTIFLTGSTTGYIATAFIMVIYLWKRKVNFLWYIVYAGVMIIVLKWALNNGIVDYFLKKLATTGANAASSNSRYYSIICGALVGLQYPLFGAGARRSEVAFNSMVGYFTKEYYCWANMVTYLWASFGCLFIYFFLRGIETALPVKKRSINICWLLFVILLLCGETMTYSAIMYVFMLYGFKHVPFGKINRKHMQMRRLI